MSSIKPWKELTFTDDYMFKKVMEAADICTESLNAFLSWDIKRITYFEEEKPLQAFYDSKGVRLDVYIHDEVDRIYDVEMQVRKMREKIGIDAMESLAKRCRFYLGQLDADFLRNGSLYSDLRPTIIIFFCPFPLFDGKRSIYSFRHICTEDPSIVLPDDAEILLITSKGDRKGLSETACALLDYMDGIVSNHPLVQKIEGRIHTVKKNEQEERDYMTYELRIREERADARAEGKSEGKAEGMAEKAFRTICNQLKRHVPYQDIASDNEVSIDEVIRIAKESHLTY